MRPHCARADAAATQSRISSYTGMPLASMALDIFSVYGIECYHGSHDKISRRLATLKKMTDHFPKTYVIKGNPADVTGGASADDYRFTMQAFLDDAGVDIIMPWFVFQDDPLEETIVDHLAGISKRHRKPVLVGGNGGPYTEKMSKAIEAKGIPVYDDIRDWVAAASALAQWGRIKK